MDSLFEAEKIYSVLELNTIVRDLIKREFPAAVWVAGEIQGLRPERDKAHTYFELVQKHSSASEIIAKIKVALFANRKPYIFKKIQETAGAFELKNDIEVKFLCEVSLHPPTGSYSLVVTDIDTVYTLGKMAANRARIIEDLKKRNLLERNRMLALPEVPLRLGLITAADSAAYHDFTHELASSGYGFSVHVYNCHMQGKNVEGDVVEALEYFNAREAGAIDAIIITRGGGSTADLAWFDNKVIAETIACSKLPVLTALGHQIDTTVSDLVAHTSFKTPTKGAQFFVERVRAFLEELRSIEERASVCADELLSATSRELEEYALAIESRVQDYFRAHKEDILTIELSVNNACKAYLLEQTRIVEGRSEELLETINNFFKKSYDEVKYNESQIRLLDPNLILKRGYSITLKEGKSIKSIDTVNEGDILTTLVYDGKLKSVVKAKERA